jgi:molybdopterin-guanine dinucleotide biosynthesis protein A
LLINSIDAKSQAFIPSYQSFQEPLFAIYHKDILPVLERQIEAQNYKLMNLLQLIKTKIIKVDDNTSFANINAPEDFKNLEAYHKPI